MTAPEDHWDDAAPAAPSTEAAAVEDTATTDGLAVATVADDAAMTVADDAAGIAAVAAPPIAAPTAEGAVAPSLTKPPLPSPAAPVTPTSAGEVRWADSAEASLATLGFSETPASAPPARWATEHTGATALTWVDDGAVADMSAVPGFDAGASEASGAALLKGAHLRPAIAGPGVLVPVGVLVGLVAAYAGTTLLWPLHEVAPTVQAVEFATTPSTTAAVTWPAQGSAAVGVDGIGTVASTPDASAIASITKVVSALMVLDRMPLGVGEQGPSFSFTKADSREFMTYKRGDQSALDVPVGGSLTEYQMLQGVLLGSANNYIDRLAKEIWGSDRAFADAASTWLRDRGITGITIVTPSGFDARNTATPEALVAVAEKAMQNPVFAEIVGTPSVELPGAGRVTNTNGMLADTGVVGVKTGTLHESWNLLTAKDVTVDGTTVRLFAAVLTQEDDDARLAATRSLFSQVEAELAGQAPAVPKGTVVGTVDTPWGASSDVVTDADADVVLWNASTATATTDFDLGEHRRAGDEVGTLTTTGPLNTVSTPLTLAQKIDGPSAWWRLTHPLELFGLTDER